MSFSMAAASLSAPSATAALSHRAGAGAKQQRATTTTQRSRGGAVRPMAFATEVAQVAVGAGGVAVFAGVVGLGLAASKLIEMRLDQRVDFEVDLAAKLGIDITDLYYDFDLPADGYPFGDGEEWMPASWKPAKIGDAKYLPTKMLGQLGTRNKMHVVLEECTAKSVDVSDLCVPFEGYEGEFGTNVKRLTEMKRRLQEAK